VVPSPKLDRDATSLSLSVPTSRRRQGQGGHWVGFTHPSGKQVAPRALACAGSKLTHYPDAMVDFAATISKAEATKVLRRVGVSNEKIADIMSELGDPIDIDRDTAILEKYGISRDVLVDRMGGSP
jgi:hypothetical protein